jgi:hypothetical protein
LQDVVTFVFDVLSSKGAEQGEAPNDDWAKVLEEQLTLAWEAVEGEDGAAGWPILPPELRPTKLGGFSPTKLGGFPQACGPHYPLAQTYMITALGKESDRGIAGYGSCAPLK